MQLKLTNSPCLPGLADVPLPTQGALGLLLPAFSQARHQWGASWGPPAGSRPPPALQPAGALGHRSVGVQSRGLGLESVPPTILAQAVCPRRGLKEESHPASLTWDLVPTQHHGLSPRTHWPATTPRPAAAWRLGASRH